MQYKAKFYSDTGWELFKDQLFYRYPENQMEVDEINRTVVFKGQKPDQMIIDRVSDYGGDFKEDY